MKKIKITRLALIFWCCIWILQIAKGQCITGPLEVCGGSQHNYAIATANIPLNTENTIWSVTNGSLLPPTDQDETGVTWGAVGNTGQLTATFVNSSGIILGVCSLEVAISPTPAVTLQPSFIQECNRKGTDGSISGYCEDQIVPFSASGAGNCLDCYKWVANGNAQISWSKGPSATVQFTEPGNAEVCVIVTSPEGCSAQLCSTYVVYANPIADFTVVSHPNATEKIDVCLGESLTFLGEYADPNGFEAGAYIWKAYQESNPDNVIGGGSGTTFIQQFNTAGSYIVELTVTNCLGCSDTKSIAIVVNENKGPEIECPSVVCEGGNPVPYCSVNVCENAMWEVVGGSFVQNPDDPNCILVSWNQSLPNGLGYVSLSCANALCPLPTTIEVPVIPTAPQIQGPTLICDNNAKAVTYSLPFWPGTTYTWSVTGAGTSGFSNPSTPNIYKVSLNGNNPTNSFTVNVTLNNIIADCMAQGSIDVTVQAYAISLSPDQHFCHNWSNGTSPILTVSPEPPVDYQIEWKISNGSFLRTIVGATNNPVLTNLDFQNDFGGNSGVFTVSASIVFNGNAQTCDGLLAEIIIDDIVPPITSIKGNLSFCPGVPTEYQAMTAISGSTYMWEVNGGVGTSTTQNINITWDNTGPYSLSVRRVIGNCFSDWYTINVEPITIPTLQINGDDTVCTDVPYTYNASAANLDSYQWTAIGGSIISGQGSPTVEVIWHQSNTGNVLQLRGRVCNININTFIQVTLGAGVASIDGPSVVCQNTSAQYVVQAAGPSATYTWFLDNIPLGATDSIISIAFPIAGQHILTVRIENFGGCPGTLTAEYPITVTPNPEPFVTQVGFLCCDAGGMVVLTATVPVGSIINENITWEHEENGFFVPVNTSNFPNAYFVSGPILTIIYDPNQVGMLGNFRITYNNGNGCSADYIHTVNCEENCDGSSCDGVFFNTWDFPNTPNGDCGMVEVAGDVAQECLVNSYFQVVSGLNGVNFTNPVTVPNIKDPLAVLGPFTQPGTYQVALAGVYDCDGNGPLPTITCADSRYITIPALSNFEANVLCPTIGSSGIFVELINTTSILPPYDQANAIAWEWTADGVLFSTEQTANFPLQAGQTVNICLGLETLVQDDENANMQKPYNCLFCREISIPAAPTPVINMDINPVCQGAVAAFSAEQINANQIVSYHWTFNLPTGAIYNSAVATPVFSFPDAGDYTIRLTIEIVGGCELTIEREIIIQPIPNVNIAVNPTTCGNKELTACNGDCNGLVFMWNTGAATPEITVSESGLYTVTVTNAAGCSNTGSRNVVIDPIFPGQYYGQLSQCQGTANISISVPLRSGFVYTFNGLGTQVDRQGFNGLWEVNLNANNLINLIAGEHTFTITARQNGNECATLTGTVTVYPNPTPEPFVVNYSCDPFMALLQANGPVSWYSAGQFISYGEQLVSYTGGNYSTVVSNQYGCTAQYSQTVKGPPNVNILTGCYCIEPELINQGLAIVKAPVGSYSYWEWRVNGNSYQICQNVPNCNLPPNLTLSTGMIPNGVEYAKVTFYAESIYESGPLGKKIVCSDESDAFCWKIGPCEPVSCDPPGADVYNIVCLEQGDGFNTYFIKWAHEPADTTIQPCPGNGQITIKNSAGIEIGHFELLDYELADGVWAFEATLRIDAPHSIYHACWDIPFCVTSNGAQCGTSTVCIPPNLSITDCEGPLCPDNLTWNMQVECNTDPNIQVTHLVHLNLNYENVPVLKGCNTYDVDVYSVTGQIQTFTADNIAANGGNLILSLDFGWQSYDSGDIICLGVIIRHYNECFPSGRICTQRFCFDASDQSCDPTDGLYTFYAQCAGQREGGLLYHYSIEFQNESNIQSCEVENNNPNGFNTVTGIVSKNKIEGEYLSYRGDLNFIDDFLINAVSRYEVREELPRCGDIDNTNDRTLKQITEAQANLKIMPNPASNIVHVNYRLPETTHHSGYNIFIVNALGITVSQYDLNESAKIGTIPCDISTLQNGVYHIGLINDKQVLSTQRLVVIKN